MLHHLFCSKSIFAVTSFFFSSTAILAQNYPSASVSSKDIEAVQEVFLGLESANPQPLAGNILIYNVSDSAYQARSRNRTLSRPMNIIPVSGQENKSQPSRRGFKSQY